MTCLFKRFPSVRLQREPYGLEAWSVPSSSERALDAPDFPDVVVCRRADQDENSGEASRQQNMRHFLHGGASGKPTGQPLLCGSEQGVLSLSFWEQGLELKEAEEWKLWWDN